MWPFSIKPDPVKEALLKEYEQAKLTMYEPRKERMENGMFMCQMVFEVSHNGSGKLGVVVARNWKDSCRAIHEINKDETFSKKDVYWTTKRWAPHKPRMFAHGLFIQNFDGLNPMRKMREQVYSVGYRILEMNTDKRPVLSFEDWKYFIKNEPLF
jgi:hypothetical protein